MRNELYVGGITPKATEEDIRKLFTIAGTVVSVHLITDPYTGDFKGCGYVKMTTGKEAKEAIDTLDGATLINKVITVSEARPQKQQQHRTGGGRGRPGQGGPGRSR